MLFTSLAVSVSAVATMAIGAIATPVAFRNTTITTTNNNDNNNSNNINTPQRGLNSTLEARRAVGPWNVRPSPNQIKIRFERRVPVQHNLANPREPEVIITRGWHPYEHITCPMSCALDGDDDTPVGGWERVWTGDDTDLEGQGDDHLTLHGGEFCRAWLNSEHRFNNLWIFWKGRLVNIPTADECQIASRGFMPHAGLAGWDLNEDTGKAIYEERVAWCIFERDG